MWNFTSIFDRRRQRQRSVRKPSQSRRFKSTLELLEERLNLTGDMPKFVDSMTNEVSHYDLAVPINATSGTSIATVEGNDMETAPEDLQFFIVPDPDPADPNYHGSMFNITANGHITAASNLTDGETYNFTIEVKDQDQNRTPATVAVTVGGQYGAPPKFVDHLMNMNEVTQYDFQVSAGAVSGTGIATVVAEDSDATSSSQLVYSIVQDPNNDGSLFNIDSSSGEITAASNLNDGALYIFTVEVMDEYQNKAQATVNVKVAPVIHSVNIIHQGNGTWSLQATVEDEDPATCSIVFDGVLFAQSDYQISDNSGSVYQFFDFGMTEGNAVLHVVDSVGQVSATINVTLVLNP